MHGGLKQTGLTMAVVLFHAYLVCVLCTFWTVVRVGLMPIETSAMDRLQLIANGFRLSFGFPFDFLDIGATFFWYPHNSLGKVGAITFLLYGLLALLWVSASQKLRVIPAIILAASVCIGFVLVADTQMIQWYEMTVKISLLVVLTGLGLASEKLRQWLVARLDQSGLELKQS